MTVLVKHPKYNTLLPQQDSYFKVHFKFKVIIFDFFTKLTDQHIKYLLRILYKRQYQAIYPQYLNKREFF